MRGTILALAAATILLLANGCAIPDSGAYPREQAQAQPRAGAPRANLHPLSTPPPGSVQPLQGYAPTRITAAYAGDAAYAGETAYAGYANAGAGYANAGYTNAGAPPQTAGFTAAPQQGGYVQSGAATGYAGDPFAGVVPNPFTPNGGVCLVEEITAHSNPNVPIQDPPVVVNRVNLTTPYPGGATTYAAMGPGYQSGPVATTAGYVPPPSGYSAGAYGPYNTSVYGGTGGQPHPTGLHYGPVEGTADIIASSSAVGLTSFSAGYGPVGSAYPAPTPPAPAFQTARYAGGAYPAVTATIPATYAPAPTPASSAPPAAGLSAQGATGIRLVPAPDVPPGIHPNDAGPSQWFEVVRPGNGPLRIGRVSSTCVCVGVRVPKRFIAAGERALIEARTVSRPQVNNLTYGIYVNIMEPQPTVVDADVTINL